jgi:ABC-2 type transport system ATP-binding protein
MSEMENTADRLVVVGRGELIAEETVAAFAARGTRARVTVRTPESARLAAVLTAAGAVAAADGHEALTVTGLPATRVGDLAFQNRIPLHELTVRTASLEEAFMELTADRAEYRAGDRR